MNENPTIDVHKVRPITKFIYTLGVLPTSYLMSMTYQEQLTWLCNYIGQTIIPALNSNVEAVQELQQLYTDLQDYVNNYFDNLDIQTEVDNKINAMYEAGTLQEIITEYLQINGVLAYDTVADMSEATNLIEGSICRTLGQTTYNDGKGNFYKVRTITSGDVVDGVNIVALDVSNTLIAERIPNYYLEHLFDKKYVFMGDSYAQGYSPDGNTDSWVDLLVEKMNLTSGQYTYTAQGGYGFSTGRSEYNYITLLNNLPDDDDLTDMYVCGGYNDNGQTEANIITGITNFVTAFKTKFPKAKLHIGFIGWSRNSDKINNLKNAYLSYEKGCNANNVELLNGCEYALHNYFKYFASDGVHPNQDGQNSLANAIYNCIMYGSCNVVEKQNMYFDVIDSGSTTNLVFEQILNNGVISLNTNGSDLMSITFTNEITLTGNGLVKIGTLNQSLIIGTDTNNISITFPSVVKHGSTYSHQVLMLVIKNGELYLCSPHASGNNYSSIDVKSIQIRSLSGIFNALNC